MPLQLVQDYGELFLIAASNDGHWLAIYPNLENFKQEAVYAPSTGIQFPLPDLPDKHYRSHHLFTADNAYLISLETGRNQPDKVVCRALGENAREVLSFESPYYPGLLSRLDTAPGMVVIPAGKRSGEIGIALYSLPHGEQISRVDGGAAISFLNDFCWLPDNTLLLRDSLERVFHLDIATNQLLASLNLSNRVVRTAYLPDASAMAVFATTQNPRDPDPNPAQWLEVLAFPSGTPRFRQEVPMTHFILDLSFSPDGTLLAVTYREKFIQILDAATGAILEQLTLDGHADKSYSRAQFLTNGTLLVRDGFTRIYAII